MTRNRTLMRRLSRAATMFVVSGLSLVLLIYVGYGEAQRNYQQFQIEKLAAQGKIVQNAMGTYLRAGLPMKQYVGFTTLAEPILTSDPTITALIAVDRSGRVVFGSGDTSIPVLPQARGDTPMVDGAIELHQSDRYYQVVLPLRNKFESVGSLVVTMPRSVVMERLERSFEPLLVVALILSAAFALFVSFGGPALSGRRTPWLQIVYVFAFLGVAGAVIGTLVTLYSEGAQTKTKALADSLGYRLSDIVEFNLNIDEFDGLDRTFGDYRRLNPDVTAAGLIVNGQVLIHTDPAAVGRPWVSQPQMYEYFVDLTRPEKSANEVLVAVALPTWIVYERVIRTVKNFAALFIACAFLAGLFLRLAESVERSQSLRTIAADHIPGDTDSETALNLVKPVFFLAVFAEHLTYSFLPQFMHRITENSGMSEGYASALFMTYYLCFALTLIPAGHVAQHRGPRPLMYLGLLLSGVGLMSLAVPMGGLVFSASSSALPGDYSVVMMARALSGIGQAMLFIGVQSYILRMASPKKMTQGAAIIVFGFQGGMISGMAIGSLLVVYMGVQGVFTLGTIIASGMALYALVLLPAMAPDAGQERGLGVAFQRVARDMREVLRNFEFLKTMTLVGIPTKAVMTGVILFALPLLLSNMNYAQEDIGQIIMIYAAGVLVASIYVPRFVDRTGKSEGSLFWGTAISGLGLLMIGSMGWQQIAGIPNASTFIVVTGVLVVGIAHGFVCAPVITHVAGSGLSSKIGPNSVAATYRFLERIGHVAGPMIIGQLFMFGGQSAHIISWVGLGIIVFALLFLIRIAPDRINTAHREASQ